MNKKALIIIGVVLVILYFVFKNKSSAAPAPSTGASPSPSATPPPTTSTDPGSSLPSPVSTAAPVSQQSGDMVQVPVAMSTMPTVFVADTTDAQAQGSAGAIANQAAASNNLPAGFQTWYNSLGPQNKAHMASLISSMPATDISFIDTVVTQNLWGTQQIEAQWNDFVKRYGLPVAGSFSNFNGRNYKRKRK